MGSIGWRLMGLVRFRGLLLPLQQNKSRATTRLFFLDSSRLVLLGCRPHCLIPCLVWMNCQADYLSIVCCFAVFPEGNFLETSISTLRNLGMNYYALKKYHGIVTLLTWHTYMSLICHLLASTVTDQLYLLIPHQLGQLYLDVF